MAIGAGFDSLSRVKIRPTFAGESFGERTYDRRKNFSRIPRFAYLIIGFIAIICRQPRYREHVRVRYDNEAKPTDNDCNPPSSSCSPLKVCTYVCSIDYN